MLSIAVDWLELTVRFVVRHGIRDILKAFDAADISIATTAYNIGGFPTLRVES